MSEFFPDIPPNSETLQFRFICISGQPLLDLWLLTKEKKNSSEYPTWDISRQHHDSDDDDNKAYREVISAPCKVRHHVILTISSKMNKELCIAALTMYQSSQATAFVPEALTATMYKAPAWCVLSLTIKRWDDMTQTCVSSAIRKDIGLQTALAGTTLRDMQLLWLSWWLQ